MRPLIWVIFFTAQWFNDFGFIADMPTGQAPPITDFSRTSAISLSHDTIKLSYLVHSADFSLSSRHGWWPPSVGKRKLNLVWRKASLDGVFVVNLGNMMMRRTYDRYVSNLDRMTNKTENESYNIPFLFSQGILWNVCQAAENPAGPSTLLSRSRSGLQVDTRIPMVQRTIIR